MIFIKLFIFKSCLLMKEITVHILHIFFSFFFFFSVFYIVGKYTFYALVNIYLTIIFLDSVIDDAWNF